MRFARVARFHPTKRSYGVTVPTARRSFSSGHLAGAPGVLSARWAGPQKDFTLAMRKVHEELESAGATDTRAHFVCVLALAWPDGHAQTFEGKVHGRIVWPPRGTRGFGYDPIFVPDGHDQTFGEMDPEKKHAMSHRAKAFAKLVESCGA